MASLPEPCADQPFVNVSALEGGSLCISLQYFVKGSSPSDVRVLPSLAFLLRHSTSGKHIVFDLGLNEDTDKHSPMERALTEMFAAKVPQDVCESLRKGGLEAKDVETIVLSHLHFDHAGNPARFPGATFVLGGESRDQLASAFQSNSFEALLLSETLPSERTRFLSPFDFTCSIGPFPRAMDYFGDGSLYLIDAAGHMAGHINVLARTSATGSWIYLAGDTAHDVRILTGEKEVAFTIGAVIECAHSDKDRAVEHIGRVGELMGVPGVLVLLAHDWQWYEDNKGGPAFFPGTIPPASL